MSTATGPSPATGIFSNFTDVAPLFKSVTKQSYAELLTGSKWTLLHSSVYIGIEATPLPSKKYGVETTGLYGCSSGPQPGPNPRATTYLT